MAGRTITLQPDMERAIGAAPVQTARVTVAEALATVRGHAHKLARLGRLGWADAEDLTAELLTAELQSARSVPGGLRRPTDTRWTVIGGRRTGRPADVLAWIDRAEAEAPADLPTPMLRADHTRAAWVKLEAKSYRRRIISRREAASDETLPNMEAEDFTEAEAEAPRPVSPAGCLLEALKLCRLAELPDSCREALAAGLYPGESQDLARAAGLAIGTFWNRASKGAATVRAAYPDPADLADLIGWTITRRRTPLDGALTAEVDGGRRLEADEDGNLTQKLTRRRVTVTRTIGAPLPESGDRHRTAPQMAREADVLMARPTRPGRAAGAAKLPDLGMRTLPAPDHWRPGVRRVDYFLPADLGRRLAEYLATRDLARSGARPHRAAHGLPAYGLQGAPEPPPRAATDALATRAPRPWIIRDGQVKGWNAR